MSAQKVDLLAWIDMATTALHCISKDSPAAQKGEEVKRIVTELINTLDNIGGLSRALRQGGPDPMDLQGLSAALSDAIDMSHEALACIGAAP